MSDDEESVALIAARIRLGGDYLHWWVAGANWLVHREAQRTGDRTLCGLPVLYQSCRVDEWIKKHPDFGLEACLCRNCCHGVVWSEVWHD